MIYQMFLFCIILSGLSLPQKKAMNEQFYNSWLRSEYFDEIKRGETPLECMKMEYVMQLYFFKGTDSVLIGSFNEGIIKEYSVESFDSLIVCDPNDLGKPKFIISICNENGLMLIIDDGYKKIKFRVLEKKYYRRNGVDLFINDHFFTGDYESAQDSTLKVSFSRQGKIEELNNVDRYKITLFAVDVPKIETVTFYLGHKFHKTFHWQKSGENIILYNLSNEDNSWPGPNSVISGKYLELVKRNSKGQF
ncbi:MAG: hypothetical protein K8H86_02620 [Ignavibacteriaceae bacterium]|nr:hypothetical protein [Ignavibacteriaceae bacterium]